MFKKSYYVVASPLLLSYSDVTNWAKQVSSPTLPLVVLV